MKNKEFIATIDMCDMSAAEFNAMKRFFESYDGINCDYVGICDFNENVCMVNLSCDDNNKTAKKLIGGFTVIFSQEDPDPSWSWLETFAPGISEIKDCWNDNDVFDLWNAYMEMWDNFDNN